MKKKKMDLWVKIIIVILVILLIFLIATFRKFLILKQISKQYDEDIKSINYYAKTYSIDDGMTELWIYEGTKMLKYTSVENGEFVERTIYTNAQNEESWIIVNSPEQKTAVQIEYNPDRGAISSAGINPGLPESNDNWHLLQMAVIANIQNSKWNGKEAYMISFNFIEQEEYRMWVNKEDYRIIGQINGTSIDVEGNTYTNILSYSYTFNTLTEEDVKIPDLTGYTIKDINGNIVQE